MDSIRKDRERRQKAREARRDIEEGAPLTSGDSDVFGSIKKAVGLEKAPPPPPKDPSWSDSLRGAVGLEKRPPSTFDTLKGMVGMEVKEPTLWDDINSHFAWSLKCRLYGFGISIGIAALFFFIGVMFIYIAMLPLFGLFYTLANISLLSSSFFLIGPMKQLQLMLRPVRLVATIIFLLALGVTLWLALTGKSFVFIIIMVIIQFCAFVWYVASYLPFAQQTIKYACGSCAEACFGR